MADANDEPNLVEPSDDERARLPETTEAYIEALEARLDARDQRIAELERELRLRDDVPEGHGWLPQAEWQRLLDVQKARVAELERERDALAAGLDRDTRSRYALIDRLNALERALRQALNRMEHVERWLAGEANNVPVCACAIEEARAALAQQSDRLEDQGYEPRGEPLADQPAQDGGHDATPENVNDYLDGHDNGLSVGYRQGWGDAAAQSARLVLEQGFRTSPAEKAQAIRNLQPDQPADAGEANTRPRCTHTRLVKNRCPVCGPLDDDNRPVTDGDTATPDACYLIHTDKGLWRPKAAGYTSNPADAGRYTYEEAVRHTRGLGPEKRAEIVHERDASAYERPCCARTREDERGGAADVPQAGTQARATLEALDDLTDPDVFWTYTRHIARVAALSEPDARRALKLLRRRGLASFKRGLLTEEGEVAGSGYGITTRGRELLAAAIRRTDNAGGDHE